MNDFDFDAAFDAALNEPSDKSNQPRERKYMSMGSHVVEVKAAGVMDSEWGEKFFLSLYCPKENITEDVTYLKRPSTAKLILAILNKFGIKVVASKGGKITSADVVTAFESTVGKVINVEKSNSPTGKGFNFRFGDLVDGSENLDTYL